ncbi:MAG: response regulator transcription factor [Armatimonadetes bacterium]|nr:response regulator transcription factor [Armatimonadota bacterium]
MPEAEKLRIFLADDHAVVREGLKTLINAEPDMEVIGEAEDGRDALEKTKGCDPDIVVMDLSMPRMNGTQATEALRKSCPDMKVLALTMHEDTSYLRSLLEAGASGYVLKRSAPQELVHALRSVAGGGTYIDPALAGKMVGSFVQKPPLRGEIEGQDLSEREEAVLRLIAQGYTNKEVGAQLSISSKSVETYKARAMEKLALESRVDIVRYAVQRGWLHGG